MKTDRKGKIDVKEKFGDYLMDISKYVFTAVIVTTLFNEIVATQYLVYIVGMIATVVTLFFLHYFIFINSSVMVMMVFLIVMCVGGMIFFSTKRGKKWLDSLND